MSPRPYQEIASDLAAGILSGKHPVGSHLPTRPELASHYGVGTGTIQKATDLLGSAGVIKTFPGGRIGALVLRLPESKPDLADIARRLERLEKHVFGGSAPDAS